MQRLDLGDHRLQHGRRRADERALPIAAPPMTTNSDGWFRTSRSPPAIRIAAEDGADDDDEADDDEHSSLSRSARIQARTTSGSKWRPAPRTSSALASSRDMPPRNARGDVSASKASATAIDARPLESRCREARPDTQTHPSARTPQSRSTPPSAAAERRSTRRSRFARAA